MDKNYIVDLKVCFPKWIIIIFTFSAIGTVYFFLEYIFLLNNNGSSDSGMFKCLFFLGIIIGGFWLFFKILFYSVIATDKGLVTNNLFGAGKSVLWDEIIEVRRPRFGIPADFTYVLLANKSKLLLVRSMKNYKALIQLIKEKAPNLQKCKS
jgi:hypothetical protein